ncbi:MAG: hypothetical protein H0V51_15130 [Chloroflexi bacterium]|nr:hypothetical protein [Chloroflexota bacterium]
MLWQNLVFAIVTPLVLAAVIAAIIVGLGSSLLWVAHYGEYTGIGRSFGALLGLHGHEIGKGLAVVVAIIYSMLILAGASLMTRTTRPTPDRAGP